MNQQVINPMNQPGLPSFPGMPQPQPSLQSIGGARNFPTLYIGDLEEAIDEQMLYSFFIPYGPIFSVRIMRDLNNKKSRGFAYLSYYNQKDAENAKINCNHKVIKQNQIRVTWKKNIRELNAENNIFVKNLDANITAENLDSAFSIYGPIFTSKVANNDDGTSRGYGYIQFENKEAADKCLLDAEKTEGKVQVLGKDVEVYKFQKKRERPDNKNNLYIRNLPQKSQDELENQLKEFFAKLDCVSSSVKVAFQKNTNIPFAFACFSNHEQAQKVLENLENKEAFQAGQPVYCVWFQDKKTRLENYEKMLNDTNVFTKNLKKDVTVQQLIEVFRQFGQIDASKVAIKEPKQDEKAVTKNIKIETNYGFIKFEKPEHAKLAIASTKDNEQVKSLYHGGQPYVNLHIRKSQYKNYLFSKNRNKSQKSMQSVDPMMLFMMMMQQFQMAGNPFFMGQPPMGGPFPQNQFQGQRGQFNRQGAPHGGNRRQNQPGGRPYYQGGKPQQPQGVKPAQGKAPVQKYTIQSLKENLQEFTQHNTEKQQSILGELLYPLVKDLAKNKDLAPKITGMLIDFDVFDVSDIIELLESKQSLIERIEEAENLISQSGETQDKQ